MEPNQIKIVALDLSLNHAGIVQLDGTGRIQRLLYVTDVQSAVKGKRLPLRAEGVVLPKFSKEDRGAAQVARLFWWERFLAGIFWNWMPTHVGIEDYAFRAESNAAYQIGELGGVARLAALRIDAALRAHDPLSVKMYAAGLGTANGRDVADSVRDNWGQDFAWANPPPPKPSASGKPRNPSTVPEEDLAAAYAVGIMVRDELALRAGRLRLHELQPKQIAVFNRTTKAYPVNLLSREWITKK